MSSRAAHPPCARRAILTLAAVVSATLPGRAAAAQDSTMRALARSGAQSTANPITLDDAIRIALAQSTTILLARNSTRLDSTNVYQARSQFLPDFRASAQSSQGYFNGSQGGSNAFGQSLGVSSAYTVFNGRQTINALREAEYQQSAGARDFGRSTQTVVFVVATDFLNLITQQEQLRVQQENLSAQQVELTQIEQFVKAETRNIGDLYQQQAAVASARLAVANARRATELAKVDLIQELQLDPRAVYEFSPPPAEVGAGATRSYSLDSLVTIAMLQRNDLRAEEFRAQAVQKALEVANAGKLPSVSLNVGYSTGFATTGGSDFATQLAQRRGGSIGVGVGLPIFDRNATSIARQRAQIQIDNEAIALRQLQQQVTLDIRRALLDLTAAQESLSASQSQQAAATLALQAAEARYRVGLATFVEVTLARAALVQAQSSVVNARSSVVFQQALMRYYTGELEAGNVRLGG